MIVPHSGETPGTRQGPKEGHRPEKFGEGAQLEHRELAVTGEDVERPAGPFIRDRAERGMSADARAEMERGQPLLHTDLILGNLEAVRHQGGAGSEVTEIRCLSPRGIGAHDKI